MGSKADALYKLIEPTVVGLGYELWGIDYMPQGKHSLLRIYIDRSFSSTDDLDNEKESGIGIEDCETVSRQLSALFDVEEPIQSEYTLEVSSPGVDRSLFKLAHYERFSGHQVSLKLKMAFEGRRKYSGLLSGVEGDEVKLIVDDQAYLFPFDAVERAQIVPVFES